MRCGGRRGGFLTAGGFFGGDGGARRGGDRDLGTGGTGRTSGPDPTNWNPDSLPTSADAAIFHRHGAPEPSI